MLSPIDVELATYVSWPAFEQLNYQGWILRFADGYTKRANSVNVLVPTEGSYPEAVEYCESFYKSRHQPAIFRLLSYVDDPELDLRLANADYVFTDPSLVLCQTLDQATEVTQMPISLDRASWLNCFNEISGADPAN
jgi:hypothetical protein